MIRSIFFASCSSLFAAVLAVAACSSDTETTKPAESTKDGSAPATADGAIAKPSTLDGGDDMETVATIDDLCASYCGWQTRCHDGGSEGAACVTSCKTDFGTVFSNWRTTFKNGTKSCFDVLACTEQDDRCFQDFKRGDGTFPNITEVKACLAKHTECDKTFPDDRCNEIAALTDEKRAESAECLDKACPEIGSCLRSVSSGE